MSLITRSSLQVHQLVSIQQYDVGLADVGFVESIDSALVNNEILSFDCLCAIPADDPLANREIVTPADLDGKPMATLFTDHPTYGQTLRAFEEVGAALNTRFETQFFMPMFTFIESGLAYSVVDPLSAEGYRIYRGDDRRVVFRPFRPKVRLMASIMTPAHRSLSNLAQAFTAALRNEIRRLDKAQPDGAGNS